MLGVLIVTNKFVQSDAAVVASRTEAATSRASILRYGDIVPGRWGGCERGGGGGSMTELDWRVGGGETGRVEAETLVQRLKGDEDHELEQQQHCTHREQGN